jgi:DNA polymerase III epsilon subunit-like protein
MKKNIMQLSYVAWDTETSGKCKLYSKPTRDTLWAWDSCRIVSIAAIRYRNGKEDGHFYEVIYPEDFTVGATHVHGISHDYALQHGKKFRKVFEEFKDFVGDDLMVAHNSTFDENTLHQELIRQNLDTSFMATHEFVCTYYLYQRDRCAKGGKLIKVYEEIFGEEFDNAHNALADARACGRIYPTLLGRLRVPGKIPAQKIVINASDVATAILCGLGDPHELIRKLWNKHLPGTCPEKTEKQVFDLATVTKPEVRRVLTLVQTSNATIQEKMQLVTETMELHSVNESKAKSYATRVVTMTHARHRCDPVKAAYYRYPVCTLLGTKYEILGSPGQVINGHLNVIKNRTKKLFYSPREYEEIQCQVYMNMMGVDSCKLVERFNGEERYDTIQRCPERWNFILTRLEHFAEYFQHEVSSTLSS